MKNVMRFVWTILSFTVPLIGISLFFMYDNKCEATLYGVNGIIGIVIYMGIGMGFI